MPFLQAGADKLPIICTGGRARTAIGRLAMRTTKDAIPHWVQTLTELLTEHTDVGSLRNRVHHLP
jgi:hypothetical protein